MISKKCGSISSKISLDAEGNEPKTQVLKVLIAAGGSGGHLFPAQQLAELLQGDCEMVFAGHKLQSSPFLNRSSPGKIPFCEIASAQPKRGNWLRFLGESWRGFCQGISLMRRFSPDVVVGFGSYHAFPVLLAAALLRKKLILFEANCILGKVNRLFLPAAKKIAIQFPLSKRSGKEVFVPYLPWAAEKPKAASMGQARAHFGHDAERQTILVFGGSQGASFLNETMPKAIKWLQGFQVIHFTGKGMVFYEGIPSFVKEFEKEMHFAYSAADLVVCRSGAGTAAELIRYRKPALLIPFPQAAENHQWKNGQFLAQTVGGARLLAQRDATPEKIAAEIGSLLRDRKEMEAALKNWKTEETVDFGALVRAVGGSR